MCFDERIPNLRVDGRKIGDTGIRAGFDVFVLRDHVGFVDGADPVDVFEDWFYGFHVFEEQFDRIPGLPASVMGEPGGVAEVVESDERFHSPVLACFNHPTIV